MKTLVGETVATLVLPVRLTVIPPIGAAADRETGSGRVCPGATVRLLPRLIRLFVTETAALDVVYPEALAVIEVAPKLTPLT